MRLFLPPEQFSTDTALITDTDHLHLVRVLRARVGEDLTLLDNSGNAYHATITQIEKHTTTAHIHHAVTLNSEPQLSLVVAQALGKGDKFEQVVQHGTEAGATLFIPLTTERCVVEVPHAKREARLLRWQAIAKGAAEQSGRLRIPRILPVMSFSQFLEWSARETAATSLLDVAPSTQSLHTYLSRFPTPPDSLAMAIGPEGGWSNTEVSRAKEANIERVNLGGRILRTETAALVALSQVLYHFEAYRPEQRA